MTWITVDVDLSDLAEDDLIGELKLRGLEIPTEDDTETLTNAWIAGRNGDKEKAYALMWEYTLNKLGKVV